MRTAMTIGSSRLMFREMTHDDFADLAEMLRDASVMYAWERAFSDAEVDDWIERNIRRYHEYGLGYFLAVDRASGEVVGQIGLLPEDIQGHTHLGAGWILKRKHWGRGYAVEGGRAMLDHAFGVLGVSRVVADIRPENTASIRVAERLGMMRCGEYDKPVGDRTMRHLIYYARTPGIVVTPYDPRWERDFAALHALLAPAAGRLGGRLEHVGSTAVPGLAAKPVIDADYILPDAATWPAAKTELEKIGFVHRGDGGLPGREMFTESLQLDFRHNFYCCVPDSPHLANHLKLRDYLRSHPDQAKRYGELKERLAREFPNDIDGYCAGKSDLISEFLAAAGFDDSTVGDINRINRSFGLAIRPAREADADALADIHIRSWNAAYRGLLPDGAIAAVNAARRDGWRRRLADTGNALRSYIAEAGGEPAGLLTIGPTRDADQPDAGEIAGIYLLPEYWRHGFGSRMLRFALDELSAKGFRQISLWVLDTNTSARRFYEKNGFRPDGAAKDAVIGGAPARELRYSLRIEK